jgi:hemin uptake protein HemP
MTANPEVPPNTHHNAPNASPTPVDSLSVTPIDSQTQVTAAIEPKNYIGPLPKLVSSQELFGKDRQILIEHAGAVYRLQITKQGKLILTK